MGGKNLEFVDEEEECKAAGISLGLMDANDNVRIMTKKSLRGCFVRKGKVWINKGDAEFEKNNKIQRSICRSTGVVGRRRRLGNKDKKNKDPLPPIPTLPGDEEVKEKKKNKEKNKE